MRAAFLRVAPLVLFAGLVAGQSQTAKTLDTYLIDVEGGNAPQRRVRRQGRSATVRHRWSRRFGPQFVPQIHRSPFYNIATMD